MSGSDDESRRHIPSSKPLNINTALFYITIAALAILFVMAIIYAMKRIKKPHKYIESNYEGGGGKGVNYQDDYGDDEY